MPTSERRQTFDPGDDPLPDGPRRVALRQLRRARERLTDQLDADDLATIDVLIDVDDPRGVMRRPDVFVASSRRIVVARGGNR